MEKGGNPHVYFIYHGNCPDGFYSALVFDLWRQAAGKGDIEELLAKAFHREQKLTMDPPIAVSGEDGVADFHGKLDKAEEWNGSGVYSDVSYYKIVYTAVDSNIRDIVKSPKPKSIAIIADIGNTEVVDRLSNLFKTVYYLDHHQSALDSGLSKPDFLARHPNTTFFYETKHSASKLIYSILLRHGSDLLQSHYSKSFGDNLTRMVDAISRGDTNSTLNLLDFEKEFKAGFCSLTDMQAFSKNGNPVQLRKIANFDFEVLQKIGKNCVLAMEKAIEPELCKAEVGRFVYQSVSLKREITLTFLMLYSNSKYRSELGNYLSQMAHEEGFDPVSLVYCEHGGKRDFFRVSMRALDLPTHEHVNLTEMSAFFNGGGHKHASGAEMTMVDIEKLRCKAIKRKNQEQSPKLNAEDPIDWKLEPEPEAVKK